MAKANGVKGNRTGYLQVKLGIEWKPDTTGWKPNMGVNENVDPIFGTRLCWQNMKVGSSTFCLLCCEVVESKTIVIRNQECKLVCFVTPPAVVQAVPSVPPYWCLPVATDSSFFSYDYNPISLADPSVMENYLTGWQ